MDWGSRGGLPAIRLWQAGGIALAARVAVILFFVDWSKPIFEYELIAGYLLDGRGFSWNEFGDAPLQPTSMFPPLYIYWCAFWMWIWPADQLLLYLSQAVAAASGVLPVFLVMRRWFGDSAAWFGVAGYALFPEIVFLTARPVSEAIFVLQLLWLLWLYLRIKDRLEARKSAAKHAVGFGLLAGVTILTKAAVLALLGAVFIALFLRYHSQLREVGRVWVVSGAMILLVMAPWMIRNYIVQDEFIPIRTAYGFNLWMGNNPFSEGNNRTAEGEHFRFAFTPEYQAWFEENRPEDEQTRDRFYLDTAVSYIKEHPGRFFELCLKRLTYFFWFDPVHPLAQNSVYRFGYIVLLLIGLPGLVSALQRSKLDSVLVLMLVGTLALYLPATMLPRYRIGWVLVLMMMGSYQLSIWWPRLRKHWNTTTTPNT